MRNIALKLMYNGTAYHGWQMQRMMLLGDARSPPGRVVDVVH